MNRNQGRRIGAVKRIATVATVAATSVALTTGAALPAPNSDLAPSTIRSAQVELAAIQDTFELLTNFARANLANLGIGTPIPGGATDASPGFPSMPLAPGAPDPADIPDLTFGLGQRLADAAWQLNDGVANIVPGRVNLDPLLSALGLDPTEAINNALAQVLNSVVSGLPVDEIPILAPFLAAAGITNVGQLLTLVGVNLSDPLNLHGGSPGLNIITAGGLPTLLRFLGIDLGWVPGSPDSITDEIINTTPLGINLVTVVNALRDAIPVGIGHPAGNVALRASLALAATTLTALGFNRAIDVRVAVVAGFGLGAFAAGEAYPLLISRAGELGAGSITVVPLVLIQNPGRANGGLFARFYPLASLAGVDVVTQDVEPVSVAEDGTATSGLSLDPNGQILIPIKVDVALAYNALSDFPAWPNLVSLANTAVATVLPTYLLRGTSISGLPDGLDLTDPNIYLTVTSDALPLMEPLRLPVDGVNLVLRQFSDVQLNNPVVTALEPAAKILTNLGYTDVDQANGYVRTGDKANVLTPFGSIPENVDWGQVPGDVFNALGDGIQQAIQDGLITQGSSSSSALLRGASGQESRVALQDSLKQITDGADQPLKKLSGTLNPSGKTPVRDAVKKAGADLKKAVGEAADQVNKTVKKAADSVSPKAKKPAA